jgi:hypothetical protein
MNYTYKLLPGLSEIETEIIQRIEDKAIIPTDPNNRDYQEYLEWLAEGNTPEPIDS